MQQSNRSYFLSRNFLNWPKRTVRYMPLQLKNDSFGDLGAILGRAAVSAHGSLDSFMGNPSSLIYLSPADYHCFHTPIAGRIKSVEALDMRSYSVTVKSDIFSKINCLSTNRRVVLTIQGEHKGRSYTCAMVIVGGVTVDSIRIESSIRIGSTVSKGQKVGAFARGGSLVALYFTKRILLDEAICKARRGHGTNHFYLKCGDGLGTL